MSQKYIFLLIVAVIFACSSSEKQEVIAQEGLLLQQQGQAFYCELQQLGEESRELWDSVAFSLQEKLPQDMPPKERANMIAIRNAGLIRMFEAFPKLPDEVQQDVDQAEKEDQEIAGRMRALNDSLKHHDLAVARFLTIVDEQLPDSLPDWQGRLALHSCE